MPATLSPDLLQEMSATLSPDLLEKMDAYWRAANYLSVGQIYLKDVDCQLRANNSASNEYPKRLTAPNFHSAKWACGSRRARRAAQFRCPFAPAIKS